MQCVMLRRRYSSAAATFAEASARRVQHARPSFILSDENMNMNNHDEPRSHMVRNEGEA